MRTILVNRTDAMGDTLLTLPLLEHLKKVWPTSKIYFLVSPKFRDFLCGNPYIEEICDYDKNLSFFKKWINFLIAYRLTFRFVQK